MAFPPFHDCGFREPKCLVTRPRSFHSETVLLANGQRSLEIILRILAGALQPI